MKGRIDAHTVLIGLGCWALATVSSATSLKEAVDEAIQTNPEVRISETRRYAADQRLNQAYAGYLPSVSITAGYGRDRRHNPTVKTETGQDSRTLTRREAGFTLTQRLFDGFEVKSAVEAGASSVKSSANNVLASAEDVALKVAESYLEVLHRKELVELTKDNLAAHEKIYKQIVLRSESGVGRLADKDQAEGRLALSRTNLIAEQANVRDATANYIRTVGKKPIQLSRPTLADQYLPKSEDTAIAMAVQYHPTLSAARSEVASSKSNKDKNQAAYWPKVNLELAGFDNHNTTGSKSEDESLSAMLRMSYTLFNGGADRAKVSEASWQFEEAKQTREQMQRQIEEGMRLSWNSYLSAQSQLRYFKQYAFSAKRTRDAYQKQFDIGQRSLLDLLDSENELYRAKSAYISQQYVELLGRYRILNSMGRLNESLKVTVPLASYYRPRQWFEFHCS